MFLLSMILGTMSGKCSARVAGGLVIVPSVDGPKLVCIRF